MALANDPVVDPLDGFGANLGDVVFNTPPVEHGLSFPVADTHDVSQGSMLLGQVLEFVVVESAAEAHGSEHEDLPVVHSLASVSSAGARVDIPGNGFQNTVSEFRLAVDVLEGFENRYDFIPAVEVQLDIPNGLAVKLHPRVKSFSHGLGSSKIGACLIETPILGDRKGVGNKRLPMFGYEHRYGWSPGIIVSKSVSEQDRFQIARHKQPISCPSGKRV